MTETPVLGYPAHLADGGNGLKAVTREDLFHHCGLAPLAETKGQAQPL